MAANGWLGVEVRHLAALAAVAREGSFGRAALSLGYTQSAISGQIATLERIVGAQLLERPRGGRPVRVTPAGAVLLRHADAIVARLDEARADLAALERGETGVLAIGIFQSVGSRVVPEAIARLARLHPGVRVTLRERLEDEALLDEVERGAVDLAFTIEPVGRSALETATLLADPFRLLVPAGHELDAPGPASLAELESAPLVVFDRCASQARLESALTVRGVRPQIVLRLEDPRTIHALVASGIGCALVPGLAAEADERVVAREIDPAVPPRVIALAWRRDRPLAPAAESFVRIVRERCAEFGGAPVAESALA